MNIPREQALLETIRQGLYASAIQNTKNTLGERSKYLGLSEIAKYAECPRSAVLGKNAGQTCDMQRLLTLQRGHWFEDGIKKALIASKLPHIHQLEISVRRKACTIKAHLDFTLVCEKHAAVRILEVKSTEYLPEEAWAAHKLQAQGQIDLLRHCWNKPVFSLKNAQGEVLQEKLTFPQICKEQLGLEIPVNPRKLSLESWLLYLSMKDASAFGPYVYSPESLALIFDNAEAFQGDLRGFAEDGPKVELACPDGFYPLCSSCAFNADCPKFRMGDYQPQWEAAIEKLAALKQSQNEIHAQISEIENALKQAHQLSETRDWIETGGHRFRLAKVSGRKALQADVLKDELVGIFSSANLQLDVDALFERCVRQGAAFPRLTISPVN